MPAVFTVTAGDGTIFVRVNVSETTTVTLLAAQALE
jgi:hypothetical protein